jgi:hypothetical protein
MKRNKLAEMGMAKPGNISGTGFDDSLKPAD